MSPDQRDKIITVLTAGGSWALAAESAALTIDQLCDALDESDDFARSALSSRNIAVNKVLDSWVKAIWYREAAAIRQLRAEIEAFSSDPDPRRSRDQSSLDIEDCDTSEEFMAVIKSALGAE